MMPAAEVYERLTRRKAFFLSLAAACLLISFLADLMTGPAMLSVGDVLTTLLQPKSADPVNQTIVWTFRLPTALMAVLVGAALGMAGAEMQTLLNNPLASPYTLGVSAAASFGAALALLFGAGALPLVVAMPAGAFLFAVLCTLAIYGLARLKRGSTETLILGGVALLFLFNSALALMQYLASEDELQAIVFWIFGSVQGATWVKLATIAAVLLCVLPLIGARAWQLTALRLGDARARSLGVDVERLRLRMLLLVSILTATAVCFAGAIGFIGLVAPHLARMLVGEDQRYFLPLSGLAGALLLSAASIASKLVIPGTIFPIGIATALLGVPFFAFMILGRRREYW